MLFTDYKIPDQIEHPITELVSQRVCGIALGYEDINHHDDLRQDTLLATLVGKTDPIGSEWLRKPVFIRNWDPCGQIDTPALLEWVIAEKCLRMGPVRDWENAFTVSKGGSWSTPMVST